MKALVLHGKDDIRYEEIEKPIIKEDEVLVKVKSTGICGSDIPRVLGSAAHYYPIVLGHEFAGEVTGIGKNVSNIKIGDKVSGAPLVPCLKCIDCIKGNYSQCKNYSFIGSRQLGSWAEYVKLPAINAVKLPDNMTFSQGVFMEPLTVALHALFVMKFLGGTDVAIIGVGTIGLLALQCVKRLGAKRIFAFDIDPVKLELAKEYGADICINTKDPNYRDIVTEKTNGMGIEQIIETAGVQATEILSMEIASNKGNIIYVGTPVQPLTLQPKEFEYLNRKELTIRGSWMSYSAPYPGKEWELAVEYLSKNKVNVEKLIYKVYKMNEINQAIEDIKVAQKVNGKIILEV